MEGIDCVEVVVESAEDEEAAGVLDAAEAELPVGAEDADEELDVEPELEDAGGEA